MILCSNSTPEADPANALDTMEAILFKSKFVDKEQLNPDFPCFKEKDITIEDDIRNLDYINAFMFIILDAFKTTRDATPKVVVDDTKLSKGNIGVSIEEFLTANFSSKSVDKWQDEWLKHPSNKNNQVLDDCHHTSDIRAILKHNGFNISSKLLNQKMDILGLGKYDKHVKVGSSISSGYKGLYINPEILEKD